MNHLNIEQQKAVNHIEGPLLVVAGAGAGKTRVICYRIQKLLEMGIFPSDILAVTFTNKAAQEMKERIFALTNANIFTSTFHSLGTRILRESIEHIGYKKDFTIYDSEDSERLIKSCLDALHIKNTKSLVKQFKHQISFAKNDLLSPEKLPNTSNEEKLFFSVYSQYQKKLKEYQALDFDDLLFLTVKLLQDNPSLCTYYQNRYLFILIDEYQDTNQAQYTIAKILSSSHKNICAVGDPDQSIYGWRGAQYQNILNFDKDFPNATIINLEQNYRSTNTILLAANGLIEHNENRHKKNLFSNLGSGEKVGIFTADTEKFEAEFVIDTILKHLSDDRISADEMAVFYRTNAQSRILEDYFLSNKIPYTIYGGISFYQRKEIKDILAFLRLVDTGSDFIAFSRVINIPKRGIGKATLLKLLSLAEEKNSSILEICKNISQCTISCSSKQKESLYNFFELITKFRENKNSIHKLLHDVISKTHYLKYLQEDMLSFEDRKTNVEELINKAHEFEEAHPKASLTEFLEELSLMTNVDNSEKNQETVKLMTLHNSKGLEFTVVFVVGLEEDILPHINAKNSFSELEEERRLCYVGMTRAKQFLYLCSSYFRHLWGSLKIMQPSRFLKEIPSIYCKNLSKQPVDVFEETYVPEERSFSIGTKIVHKIFGIGIIKKAYTTSLGDTYDVYFETLNTTKSLVAKYAKLKPYY